MTHRIEITSRLPDGNVQTIGVDCTGDAPEAPARRAAFAAALLALHGGRILGEILHQRGPFPVPERPEGRGGADV